MGDVQKSSSRPFFTARAVVVVLLAGLIGAGVLLQSPRIAQASELDPISEEGETTDISAATATVADQTYTGFAITPDVTVELDGVTLIADTDYTLAFSNNTEIGTATATVTGAGIYEGSLSVDFAIKAHPQGWDSVDGTYYYYTAAGTMLKNGFAQGSGARYYYMGADGKNVTQQWVTSGGKTYYVGLGGFLLTNNWVKSDGKYYYVNAKGNPVSSSWQKISGKYYYFNGSGNPVTSSWQKIGGKYYYFNASGNPVMNSWQKIGGKYYYFNGSGNPVTSNWVYSGGKYYYMNASGNPLTNSWLTLNGSTYHFNGSGVMQTGLVTINGEAYIFNDNGTLRYISNDSRVDRIVCKIIRDYTGFNVRKAYDFVANSFTYVKSSTRSDFSNWAEYYALNLWNTGKGNCFGYSALFHFLLKAMGYSSKVIAGTCMHRSTGVYYDHCWVEVYQNGQTYVCDPVLENAYQYPVINSYFITYAQNKAATTWIVYVV